MQSCINGNNAFNVEKSIINSEIKSNIEILNKQTVTSYPVARWKHAAVIYNNYLYIMGGYSWTNTLKDLWRLNLTELNKELSDQFKSLGMWNSISNLSSSTNLWEDLSKFMGKISPLQSHTMVAYKNKLFIFGGAFTYDARNCPFWIYDIDNEVMQKWKPLDANIATPIPRRNHSCCIYRKGMVVFGGFGDVRGSLGDLWAFDFENGRWHLIWNVQRSNNNCKRDFVKYGPRGRHDHRAVVHNNKLFIFGGMCGLEICNDLWQWNFDEYQWTKLFYKGDHGDLSYITDVKINNHWLLFGINDNKKKTEKWIYSFNQNKWTTSTYYIPEFNPFCTLSWFSKNTKEFDIYHNITPPFKSKFNKVYPITIDSLNRIDSLHFENINLETCKMNSPLIEVKSPEIYQSLTSFDTLSKDTEFTDLTESSQCETTFINNTKGEEVPIETCDRKLLIVLGNNIDKASFDYHLNTQLFYI